MIVVISVKPMRKILIFIVCLAVASLLLITQVQELEQLPQRMPELTAETVQEPPPKLPKEPPEQPTYKGVLIPSYLSSEQLERGLLGELKQYAPYFIQAEQDTGINAIFLSSVATLESGWGKSKVAKTKNNLFGWTAKGGYRSFKSPQECIAFVAEQIKALYLTPGGIYFNGFEVEDVNVRYNGRQSWENNVTQIMSQITARINKES